ncbi:GyrI-like domain-containing protein [Candidatus Halobeggiatoa sp. HSG11]|nr:GyrI-like domain-containing protein [Candidatus Halobeggiatoa sp. HSG11]
MKNETPKIEKLTEKTVVFVSYTGNYMNNPQIFVDLSNKLCGWAGPKGLISPKSIFLSSYQDNPEVTPPDELKLDLCMVVSDETQVDSDIQKKNLPGGQYVVMYAELEGPEEYGPAWNAVVEWMKNNNHEIDMSRPSYEIYLNNPEEHPEKHHIVNICMSLKNM